MRAILTYHSIDDSGSPISVSPKTFERHVRWFSSGTVRVASLDELSRLGDDDDAVALTFDDGFESVKTHAVPVLREHGFTATLFVVTDHVGTTNAWQGQAAPGIPVMPLLDWPELAALVEAGWALGAHTRTHRDLTALGAGAVRAEIEGSLEAIEQRVGTRPRGFAYPYGRVNETVARIAESICERAYTTSMRRLSASDAPHLLPRLDAYYFQSGPWLENWGRPQWHAYVTCRAMARGLRQLVAR